MSRRGGWQHGTAAAERLPVEHEAYGNTASSWLLCPAVGEGSKRGSVSDQLPVHIFRWHGRV